jgi:hypothetical protein
MSSPSTPVLSPEHAGMALCRFLSAHPGASVDDLAPLLRLGPDLHVKRDGYLALSWACWEQRTDVVRTLIAAGAPVDSRNDDGTTALHLAVQRGNCAFTASDPTPWRESQTTTALLIEHGASVHLPCNRGLTPFMALLRTCDSQGDASAASDPRTVQGNVRAHAEERRSARAAIMGQLLDAGAHIGDLDRYAAFENGGSAEVEVEAFLRSRAGTPAAASAVQHLATLLTSGGPNATWAAAALADAGDTR